MVIFVALSLSFVTMPKSLTWIQDEGFRGAFLGYVRNSTNVLREKISLLREAGINTVIYYPGGLGNKQDAGAEMTRFSQVCSEEGMHSMIFFVFFQPGLDYRRAVQADGVESNIYCPLDQGYWKLIEDEILFVADRSKGYKIDGVLIDLEQYGGQPDGQSATYGNNTCLCDHCFGSFTKKRGFGDLSKSVSPAKRGAWLNEKGLLSDYYAYLKEGVAKLYRETVKKVHKVNPTFLIGFTLWTNDNWYFDILPKAFGTGRVPALILDESTYYDGYFTSTPESDKLGRKPGESFAKFQTRYVKALPGNAIYVPGFYVCQYFDYNFGEHVYNLARDSGGYWLFYADTFLGPNSVPEWDRPHAVGQSYLAQLREVNAELDKGPEGRMDTPDRDFSISDLFSLHEEANRLRLPSFSANLREGAEVELFGPSYVFLYGQHPRIKVTSSGEGVKAMLVDNGTYVRARIAVDSYQSSSLSTELATPQPLFLMFNSTGGYKLHINGCLASVRLPFRLSGSNSFFFEIPKNSTALTVVSLSGQSSCLLDVGLERQIWHEQLENRDQIEIPISGADWGKVWSMNLTALKGHPEITMWIGRTTPALSIFPEVLQRP